MPLKGETIITCGSARTMRRQVGLWELVSNLVRSPTVIVTVENSASAPAGLPAFQDRVGSTAKTLEEYLLQAPLSRVVLDGVRRAATALPFNVPVLTGNRTTKCSPHLAAARQLAAGALHGAESVTFSCHLPTSAFCAPGAELYSLDSHEGSIKLLSVEHNNDAAHLWALAAFVAAFGFLFLRPIYVTRGALSQLSFAFFGSLWWLVAPTLTGAAAVVAVGIALRLFLPGMYRTQLHICFQAAAVVLVTQASSFAYGSLFLLIVYLFAWVVHAAVRMAMADEAEEEEAIESFRQHQADQLKQEGLSDIVEAVLEDKSILERLSDKAVAQIARMSQARALSETSRLDDLSPEQRREYDIYQEGRAVKQRLQQARWVPLAAAVLVVGFWRLGLPTLLVQLASSW